MRNVMASSPEAELGWLFENCHSATSMRTALAEMVYLQPSTLVATENIAANSIVNKTEKQKRYRAVDMRFYWVRDRIRQNHLRILWEEGKKNMADYVTKHHPIWDHRAMRPRYVKATKKIYKTQNTGKLGPERVCWNYHSRGIPETR